MGGRRRRHRARGLDRRAEIDVSAARNRWRYRVRAISCAFAFTARARRCATAARRPELYLHHSKVNAKAAIEGSVWPWHQDYGAWKLDGIQKPDMATFMVMLDEATELSGCLYLLPGSHRWGRTEAYLDTSTAYRLWSVTPEDMKRRMAESPPPVAVTGRAGTCAIFHCNLMHASGHNLSHHDRWQAYFCFNTCANRPLDVPSPRPDYVRSRNWEPMRLVADGEVLACAIAASQS